MGVLHARGELILFADADGATKFYEYKKWEEALIRLAGGNVAAGDDIDSTFPGVAIGSR